MKKSKIFMIVSICTLCLSIIVSTYAMYRENLFDNLTVDTITNGLDYYISYDKGTDITAGTLDPSEDYTGGNSATITFGKKDNTYDIYGHIYLDIGAISSSLSSSTALKYALTDTTGSIIASGNLAGSTAGSSVLIKANIPLDITSKTYTVYLWLDEQEELDPNLSSETLTVTVRCEASMKTIAVPTVNYISDLYYNAPKESVTNNNITYNKAPSVKLMSDRLGGTTKTLDSGNIRYYGTDPNNYVYFNCSDYNNQTSDSCEVWRIIGVFNGNIKIMRQETIGKQSWNTTIANDWANSSSKTYLNETYYNSLKNTETKNMILSSTWNLGGSNSVTVYSDALYQAERGTTICSGCSFDTTTTANIALIYASDYSYAAEFGADYCNSTVGSYTDTTCANNNWMKPIFTSTNWVLNNNSANQSIVWTITSTGTISAGTFRNVTATYDIIPTVYLKSTTTILAGDGTISNPYQLQ